MVTCNSLYLLSIHTEIFTNEFICWDFKINQGWEDGWHIDKSRLAMNWSSSSRLITPCYLCVCLKFSIKNKKALLQCPLCIWTQVSWQHLNNTNYTFTNLWIPKAIPEQKSSGKPNKIDISMQLFVHCFHTPSHRLTG